MKQLLPQELYRNDVEYIDKDHAASMFMATCELNKITNEAQYRIFVYATVFNMRDSFNERVEKEREARIAEVNKRYDAIIRAINEDREAAYHQYYMSADLAIEKENEKRAKEIQAIRDNTSGLEAYIIERTDLEYYLSKKVFYHSFKYPSAWTYNDVLLYFKKHGFPPSHRRNMAEIMMDGMNVCRARHLLRNDLMMDEAVLLALLEMWIRKEEIELQKERDKIKQIFLMVVGAILAVAALVTSIMFPGAAPLWMVVCNVIAGAAGVASAIVGVVKYVLAQENEAKIKDITAKTRDLMIKAMPKPSNFVDTAITDPYAMYANGRLWKQGGAGYERYDCIKPNEPYRYLDDKFNDSDVFAMLQTTNQELAGRGEYYTALYKDGKWCNPEQFKALLNGQIPHYLGMRNKILQELFKWLTKNDYGTYYLDEMDPAKPEKRRWNNFNRVEFEDSRDIYGFTELVQYYNNMKKVHYAINQADGSRVYYGYYLGYVTSVSTKWDKEGDNNKTESKWHNITDHSRIDFVKEETKVLKGSEVRLQWVDFIDKRNSITAIRSSYKNPYNSSYWSKLAKREYKHKEPYCNGAGYYECTYKHYKYGKKDIYFYSEVKQILNYTEGKKDGFIYGTKLVLQQPKIHAPIRYIWEVRGQLENVSVRFRARDGWNMCDYAVIQKAFLREETQTSALPHIQRSNRFIYFYRCFDKGLCFGYYHLPMKLIARAQQAQRKFVKTTVYCNANDYSGDDYYKRMTYFSLSPFLSADATVTYF